MAQWNKADVSEDDAVNIPAPCDVSHFRKQVERLGRDVGSELRVKWAPDVWWIVGDNVKERPYAVYMANQHDGWFVFKAKVVAGFKVRGDFEVVRYAQPGELSQSPKSDGYYLADRDEYWIPDWHVEQIACRRWVLEEKLSGYAEEYDRQVHNLIRYDTDPTKPFVMEDFLREYPKEGKWQTLRVIADHDEAPVLGTSEDGRPIYGRPPCCVKEWEEEGGICYGRYRPPNERDLEYVAGLCNAKRRLLVNRDPNDPPTVEERHREYIRYLEDLAKAEEAMGERYAQMLKEPLLIGLRAHMQPKFDMGAAHQKAEQNQNLIVER